MLKWKHLQNKESFVSDTLNERKKFIEQYYKILLNWETESPPPPDDPHNKKPWVTKKTKDRNLLERFLNYKEEILRFLECFECPFTNNQWERDLRMAKVQQKISGCFRTTEGAQEFAIIRSYIDSAKKQWISAAIALENLLNNKPFYLEVAE